MKHASKLDSAFSHASMNVPHLLPALLLILMTAAAVRCFHVLCSWRPGPLPPAAYGFDTHWCKADLIKTDNGKLRSTARRLLVS